MAEKETYKQSDLDKLRHSTAHIMAEAVLELFPEGKIAFGPPIEDGFYYDFDLPRSLTPDDLREVEARMREIIAGQYPLQQREVGIEEAKKAFADQPYKLEQIERLAAGRVDEHGEAAEGPAGTLSLYTHHNFTDLCRGPHLDHTGQVSPEALKLLSVAGAYWLGDESRPMLQRIYGTVWPSKEELEAHLHKLEEMEKRDHRKLGRELDLFSVHQDLGAGLILWHPKGGMIRTIVEDFWRQEHYKAGYELVYSPHIGRANLWQTSGHLDFYRESMYSPMDIEGQEFFIKPMNCPFHIMMYRSRTRSYRELPLRWAELGTVYRYERSGVLHGLLRVRGFTQDDAHIFCRPDQIEDEVLGCLDLTLHLLRSFGFHEYKVVLSVRDPEHKEKYIGDDAMWEVAEGSLIEALGRRSLPYTRMEGEAVFYGPKIDIHIKDTLGRYWQLTTIQFDFNLPERFDMTFVGQDGREHRPYMVHRALLGSMERFFGILIEHYGGAFPVWLAPVQVKVIPIADRHNEYAHQVAGRLREAGLRVEVDDSSERMQAKIRDAQLQKIPYMLVMGDREAEKGTVAVRLRTEEDLGPRPVEEFISMAREAIAEKRDI
ncbi:MAG: threonine--tRNA ligase [Anaerolineales bacterium]|nr:MAG: threonine--tRNA ligase [Anaerolineales bacterium]